MEFTTSKICETLCDNLKKLYKHYFIKMNLSKIIICILISFAGFSQNQLSGRIFLTDTDYDYHYITVLLKKKDSILTGSQIDSLGNYKLVKKIPSGNYKVVINHLGEKDMIIENIIVDEKDLVIDIKYPGPCTYFKNKPRKCVGSHTDNIIPIVYGLPSKIMIKKAKKGKIHLGGCEVSKCDPYFFCKTHNIEL